MPKIKVRMTVTVEVDPAEWAESQCCDREDVREDVRTYFAAHIGQAPAVEDTGLTVRIAR